MHDRRLGQAVETLIVILVIWIAKGENFAIAFASPDKSHPLPQ